MYIYVHVHIIAKAAHLLSSDSTYCICLTFYKIKSWSYKFCSGGWLCKAVYIYEIINVTFIKYVNNCVAFFFKHCHTRTQNVRVSKIVISIAFVCVHTHNLEMLCLYVQVCVLSTCMMLKIIFVNEWMKRSVDAMLSD